MKKWMLSFHLLLMCCLAGNAQSLHIQYWFDSQFANAITDSMNNTLFQSNVPTTGLMPGMHTFHYRVKDTNQVWSVVNSRSFYIKPQLAQYQYWFDDQYAQSNLPNIPEGEQFIVDSILLLSSFNPGIHSIHYRFKNTAAKWSSVSTVKFAIQPKIDMYEYWFDQNYQTATQVTLPQAVYAYQLDTNLVNLPTQGTGHTLHIRFHYNDGHWSSVESEKWIRPNRVIGFEYWFNDQYNTVLYQTIPPISNWHLQPSIDVSSSPLGSNKLLLRFKDENGRWSAVITGGFCHNQGDSSIHLNLFLEGFYNGANAMQPVLLNQGISNDVTLVDSIDVSLHAATSPFQTLASQRVPLFTDGSAACNFPWTYIGNYYLAVNHRNSIETWTSHPIYRGECPLTYDFTDAETKAYGSNLTPVGNGVWAFYTGDINQDENIDLLDASLLEVSINNFEFGYLSTDLNGDGNVDLLDSPVAEPNISQFIFSAHP